MKSKKFKEFYARIWDIGFDDVRDEWELERLQILKNIDPNVLDRKIQVDWSDDDEADDGSRNGGNNQDSHEVPLDFDPAH